MKIVHIGKYDYHKFGGIEKVCFDIINELSINNHIIFLYFGKKNHITKYKNITKYSSKVLINIFSQPVSLSFIVNYFKILKLKPNIIHVHLPNYLILFCLFFTKNIFLKKTIIHWHSDVINKNILFQLLSFLEKNILNRVHAIISTSNEYATSSNILIKFIHKVKIIPICIKSSSDIMPFHNKITNTNTNNILAVGRLVPYKGFDILIKACSLIKSDFTLKIVGSGTEYYYLCELIKNYKLDHKIQILNNIANEDLYKLYQNTNIFCMPSINRAEAYGISMLEAISHGIATISFEIEGSGLNYVNSMGIKVKNIKSEDLYKNLDLLLKDKTLRESISKNNLTYYKENFNFNNYINSYLSLYNSI